jgi:demethylmenaquinone methyltransferase/2-methoxy-6-polyprenyl-1,4-benzoquinol methylase
VSDRAAAAGSDDDSDQQLLADQRSYYRQRAPEYDEWWQRIGRYDHGPDQALDWDHQVRSVTAALAQFGATGDVLELAGGTGWWTERLALTARTLTVLDAAPETLEINRTRLADRSAVSYVVADLFEWHPERTYDTVFFSFWLSHVPRGRFAQFFELVRQCLGPGGRAFFVDNRLDPTHPFAEHHVFAESDGVQRRTLNDGSEHRLVKIFYEPDELAEKLVAQGWKAAVAGTRWFIYGSAQPSRHPHGRGGLHGR